MQGTAVGTSQSAPSHQVGAIANSSSPAPGPGRAMTGKVQGFDSRTGMGRITGSDGTTFSFFGAGVLGGVALLPGQSVEFTDNDGVATKIKATGDVVISQGGIGGVANSASPPPGPGRPMRGTVKGFDARTGMGKIQGDDDTTYSFYGAGVIGGASLSPGQTVEFNDKDGIATQIVPAGRSAPLRQSNIGAVSNSASPPPSPGRPMRGTVLGFDARTGMGKIRGEDETTYSFYSAGVVGGKPLKKGRKVTFTDKDGIAVEIKRMRGRLMRVLFGP